MFLAFPVVVPFFGGKRQYKQSGVPQLKLTLLNCPRVCGDHKNDLLHADIFLQSHIKTFETCLTWVIFCKHWSFQIVLEKESISLSRATAKIVK